MSHNFANLLLNILKNKNSIDLELKENYEIIHSKNYKSEWF